MEDLKEGEVINCLARPFCIAKLTRRLQIMIEINKTLNMKIDFIDINTIHTHENVNKKLKNAQNVIKINLNKKVILTHI
jgi:hypothetical protein